MDFIIPYNQETILNIARKIGYKVLGEQENGEYNIVRDLSRGYRYPRFHIYIKKDEENNRLLFSLHLDQKQPSYGKETAHSGEYDTDIVKNEAERIKSILDTKESRVYKF